jgi:hypothetical protein
MTERNWPGALEHHTQAAKTAIIRDGALPARFTLFLPDGSLRIYEVEFINPAQKAAALKFISIAAMAYNADGVCTVIEAWSATMPPISDGKTLEQTLKDLEAGNFKAREQPDRFEAIYVSLAYYRADDTRELIGTIGTIRRDQAGIVRDVTDMETTEPTQDVHGSLAKIVAKKRAPSSSRNAALRLMGTMPPNMLYHLHILASVV